MHYEAIQLFVERAQAVMPGFTLTETNAATVARICARIDGLPLAIELAAARVKVLPPPLLLERLVKARLTVLTGGARNLPGRQQTLRNTIIWSDNLLSPTEQAWFRRLGVFTGGWSLEAVEAMMQSITTGQEEASVSLSPLDLLEQLVDSSLLIRLPVVSGRVRFTMLETLREYVLERLTEQGEIERLRDWHACYYLCKAEAAERGLKGPEQLMWLHLLIADRDNFRTALEWSLQGAREGRKISAFPFFGQEHRIVGGSKTLSTSQNIGSGLSAIELCLRLAAALRASWEWQGYLTEARHWLETALEVRIEEGVGETVLAAQAKALSEYSRLACLQNEQPRAVALAEESIAIWRQLNDPIGLANALLHRGWATHAMNEYKDAMKWHEEGLQHLSKMDDPWLYGQLLFYVGAAKAFMGDFDGMRSYYGQGREIFEQIGDRSGVADVLKDQGGLSMLEGNCAEAIRLLTKSIHLCYDLNHRQYMTTGLCLLSMAFGLSGEPDPYQASIYAAQLEGVADSLMETIGLKPWTKNNPFAQMIQQQLRSRIDEQSWNAAWNAGRALTLDQAIDLVDQLASSTIEKS
jgi:predicted ATPase